MSESTEFEDNPTKDRESYGSFSEKKGYKGILKDKFCDEDWKELEKYIRYLQNQYSELDIEDEPEMEYGRVFFKSFFGKYQFDSEKSLEMKINKEKISEEKMSDMMEDILNFVVIPGVDLDSVLKFILPSYSIEKTIIYSELLEKITSIILSERPPIQPRREEYISPENQGQIDILKTIKRRSRGENHVVSTKANITMETLPVLIFVKFHAQMLIDLENFWDEENITYSNNNSSPEFALERKITERKAHHKNILSHPLYSRFYEKAIRKDLKRPEILENARRETVTSPTFKKVITLWEAYLGKSLPRPKTENILEGGYSLKPASKIYEIWVLKKLVDLLEDKYSEDKDLSKAGKGGTIIDFDKKIELTYNTTLKNRFSTGTFSKKRPDFAIRNYSEEKVPLILDAKYKKTPKADDFLQMVSYEAIYGIDDPEEFSHAILLYIGTKGKRQREDIKREKKPPRIKIKPIKLRPNEEKDGVTGENELRDIIEKVLE